MPVTQTSFDNIKVGYISETDGYIQNVSIADANTYAELNPDTEFIFIDGDEKVRFLTIGEVNALTPKNLLRSDPCLTGDLGTGNLGTGNLTGGLIGVVVQVIVRDSGQGYLPPPQTVPQYPAALELTGVTVTNSGFNYNCGVDTIEVIPSNGTVLSYSCDPFGKIKSVSVDKGGRFTELPQIRMNTETGVNAAFVPNFDIIRDPQPIDPVITQEDLVQVFDLVGLNINGYIDGKPYYGNVYYVNGIRYAGTSAQTSGTNIIVYDTRLASLQKRLDTVSTVTTGDVEEPVTEIETREDTVEAISSPSRGSYSTTPTSAPSTTPTTSTPSTTPASGGTYSAPATPTPAPSSTPSTPAPSTPSPSSGGGGGGYGGGY
jgi:hypothetical protein